MAKAAEESVVWAKRQTWVAVFGLAGVTSRSARAAERAMTDLERPFIYMKVRHRGFDSYVTGFCAIWDAVGGTFILRCDERYNYTRKENEPKRHRWYKFPRRRKSVTG